MVLSAGPYRFGVSAVEHIDRGMNDLGQQLGCMPRRATLQLFGCEFIRKRVR